MNTKINNIKKTLQNMQMKVVEVTKTNYTLENGDVYEHTFDIDESITVEEFQILLDNAKSTILNTLNKIDKDEL
jgi:arabinogalactan endo-1,4-beta-galactosidase